MSNLVHVAPVFLISDMDRSLLFYQHQLGFELDFNYNGTYASVVREGCHLHLKKAVRNGRNQVAFEAAGYVDACFKVSDASALASQFADAGVTFSVPLRRSPYGSEFYVKDPDGHILAFVQSSSSDPTQEG